MNFTEFVDVCSFISFYTNQTKWLVLDVKDDCVSVEFQLGEGYPAFLNYDLNLKALSLHYKTWIALHLDKPEKLFNFERVTKKIRKKLGFNHAFKEHLLDGDVFYFSKWPHKIYRKLSIEEFINIRNFIAFSDQKRDFFNPSLSKKSSKVPYIFWESRTGIGMALDIWTNQFEFPGEHPYHSVFPLEEAFQRINEQVS